MQIIDDAVDALRGKIGNALFATVAGADADAEHTRIHDNRGERWFDEDSVIRRVHGDSAMFIGGIRALLLQSLHPLPMAAVAQFSDYRHDPWGRLQRTAGFIAETTYATAEDSQRAVDRVRRIHEHVSGVAPDGREFHANDPHLLLWVHIAEIDSFLRCHQRYGAHPLTEAECDTYIAETAKIATALGSETPPTTRAELNAALDDFRPELRGNAQSRAAARFLVWNPPVRLYARGAYGLLAAAAVAELPFWTRRQLWLPFLPITEATVVQLGGRGMVNTIRWAMQPEAA